MSVSLREIVEAAGYDLSSKEDAQWLISTQEEYDDLLDEAEELINTDELEDEVEAVNAAEADEALEDARSN